MKGSFRKEKAMVITMETILNFLQQTGFSMIMEDPRVLVMIVIAFALLYLAIKKGFEPLLLMPIAFGMLLTNLPGVNMYHTEFFSGGHVHWDQVADFGLIDYLYLGVKLGIYPCADLHGCRCDDGFCVR